MRAAIIWRRLTMVSLDTGFLLVDVRDIAKVIAAAITSARQPSGPRRFLAGHHYVAWPELCRLVAGVTGRRVLHPRVPAPVLRALGRGGDGVHHLIPFNFPLSREAMETATRMVPMQDQETVDELGVAFRPPEETLHDAYRWLYDTGRIPAWLAPALAHPGPGA
jgi:dihydroflavonol-4-reductase